MERQRMPGAWLSAPSTALTVIAASLASVAAMATTLYLDPAGMGTWVNVVIGILVMAAPLVATGPLTRARLLITTSVWLSVGVPGSYVFGIFVVGAGILLGTALVVDAAISCWSTCTLAVRPEAGGSGGTPRT
jgi:hypothetical protein